MTKIIPGGFTKKQLFLIAIGFTIFYFSFDYLGDAMFKMALGGNSDAILATVHDAKLSPSILRRTGDISSDSYNIHKPATSEDSATLRIDLKGEKANVLIKSYAVREATGIWIIYQSDTTFSN
ncbi:MAG: hypothetical protein EOO58_01045 [Hymenobacter sp.]|nr:MAG: hypothetical protein EOO58_01045 [Hymenobacter sp.]